MDRERIDQLFEEAGRDLDRGNPEGALSSLDELQGHLLDSDDRVEWTGLRAWALSELRRFDEALDLLEEAIEEFPDAARLHGTRGVVLSNADDLDGALDSLETAHEMDPEDETTVANLALIYEKLREFQKAIRLYDEAIQMGVNIDWALQRRAAALREAGDSAEAKRTLKRYLSLVPDDATEWLTLALLHADDEEYDEAFACFASAERLNPDDPELRLNWGYVLARTKQTQAARAQLTILQKSGRAGTRHQLLEAAILEAEHKVRLAEQCYERILAEVTQQEPEDLVDALEQSMDFFARRRRRKRCEQLLKRAYEENACTVELCEAFREVAKAYVDKAAWYSIMVEADYRDGLVVAYERGTDRQARFSRYLRNFQVVARDRDEAVALVLEFAARMGERHARVREIIREEPLQDTHVGIYEIERDCLAFVDNR